MFQELIADHRRVERLFEKLDAGGQASKPLDSVCREICNELTVHSQLEEKVLYPRLQTYEPLKAKIKRSFDEHMELKNLIAEISSLKYQCSNPDVQSRLKRLEKAVRTHVDEEENQVFPLAEQTVDRTVLQDLQSKMQELREQESKKLATAKY